MTTYFLAEQDNGDDVAALVKYAEQKIAELGLGDGGSLGTEFVCVYDDAGPGKVRISDGHGEAVCSSTDEIDSELQEWCDWIAE